MPVICAPLFPINGLLIVLAVSCPVTVAEVDVKFPYKFLVHTLANLVAVAPISMVPLA